jgi:RNA ligase (TIGR02306 family)
MAFFGVTIEQIKTIEDIEGADRIQKATLCNLPFTFVILKGAYEVGETVLYFPIDSVIPESLAIKLGVAGKLAGKRKDRVKTICLKKVYSQGVVGKFDIIVPHIIEHYGPDWATSRIELTPEKITEWLGVLKYEPPSILEKGANLRCLPCGLSIYDIEGCERNKDIVEILMPQLCYISEKVEGSNFSVSFDGTKVWVNQRRHTIEQIEGETQHTWWKVAIEQGLVDLAKELYAKYNNIATIYGEMVGPGIQGNIYKLPKHSVYVFDIKIGAEFIGAEDFMSICNNRVQTAPLIKVQVLSEFLSNYKSVVEASHGPSLIYKETLREGIVIKPVKEQILDRFGRLIIKQRDPIYLAGNEN